MDDSATGRQPPTLGILSLDTRFPRLIGDVGCPESYPFPVEIAVVKDADSPKVVRDGAPGPELLAAFEDAARDLEKRGVSAIVSTCGFLVTAQARVAAAVNVPVMLSGLSMTPMLRTICPGRIGILTASSRALGPQSLAAAGLREGEVAIAGMEDVPAFAKAILVTRNAQPSSVDQDAIRSAVVEKALGLRSQHPDLSAILLECGNLPPYADAIRAATGLPVFHLLDAAITMLTAQGGPHYPA